MGLLVLAQAIPAVGVLIHLLILVIVLGLIVAVVWWAIATLPLPAPFAQVARVILILIVLLVLLYLLLPLLGVA